MGSLLLTAGAKGMRYSLPNSRIMVHQPSGGFQGQATDIMIHARETQALKDRLNQIYHHHTGQSVEAMEAALERDRFMTAQDAKDWGLIDEIVTQRDVEVRGLREAAGAAGSDGAFGLVIAGPSMSNERAVRRPRGGTRLMAQERVAKAGGVA